MITFAREQAHAMKRAQDMEDLADVLESDGEHVLAGSVRATAGLIRALWSDAE